MRNNVLRTFRQEILQSQLQESSQQQTEGLYPQKQQSCLYVNQQKLQIAGPSYKKRKVKHQSGDIVEYGICSAMRHGFP